MESALLPSKNSVLATIHRRQVALKAANAITVDATNAAAPDATNATPMVAGMATHGEA